MAALDWSECSAVESVSRQGQRRLRVQENTHALAVVFESLEDGMTDIIFQHTNSM